MTACHHVRGMGAPGVRFVESGIPDFTVIERVLKVAANQSLGSPARNWGWRLRVNDRALRGLPTQSVV